MKPDLIQKPVLAKDGFISPATATFDGTTGSNQALITAAKVCDMMNPIENNGIYPKSIFVTDKLPASTSTKKLLNFDQYIAQGQYFIEYDASKITYSNPPKIGFQGMLEVFVTKGESKANNIIVQKATATSNFDTGETSTSIFVGDTFVRSFEQGTKQTPWKKTTSQIDSEPLGKIIALSIPKIPEGYLEANGQIIPDDCTEFQQFVRNNYTVGSPDALEKTFHCTYCKNIGTETKPIWEYKPIKFIKKQILNVNTVTKQVELFKTPKSTVTECSFDDPIGKAIQATFLYSGYITKSNKVAPLEIEASTTSTPGEQIYYINYGSTVSDVIKADSDKEPKIIVEDGKSYIYVSVIQTQSDSSMDVWRTDTKIYYGIYNNPILILKPEEYYTTQDEFLEFMKKASWIRETTQGESKTYSIDICKVIAGDPIIEERVYVQTVKDDPNQPYQNTTESWVYILQNEKNKTHYTTQPLFVDGKGKMLSNIKLSLPNYTNMTLIGGSTSSIGEYTKGELPNILAAFPSIGKLTTTFIGTTASPSKVNCYIQAPTGAATGIQLSTIVQSGTNTYTGGVIYHSGVSTKQSTSTVTGRLEWVAASYVQFDASSISSIYKCVNDTQKFNKISETRKIVYTSQVGSTIFDCPVGYTVNPEVKPIDYVRPESVKVVYAIKVKKINY